jgi:hypothetical protein
LKKVFLRIFPKLSAGDCAAKNAPYNRLIELLRKILMSANVLYGHGARSESLRRAGIRYL